MQIRLGQKVTGAKVKGGVFFIRANARAHSIGEIDGRVKVLADARSDRILGHRGVAARAVSK